MLIKDLLIENVDDDADVAVKILEIYFSSETLEDGTSKLIGYGHGEIITSSPLLPEDNVLKVDVIVEDGVIYCSVEGSSGISNSGDNEDIVLKLDLPVYVSYAVEYLLSTQGMTSEEFAMMVEQMAAMLEQVIIPWYENSLLPNLPKTEITVDEEALSEAINAFVSQFYQKIDGEAEGDYTIKLSFNVLNEWYKVLEENTVAAVIDMIFGEGTVDALIEIVPAMLHTTVGDMLDQFEANGGNLKGIYNALNELVAILTENPNMTIDALIMGGAPAEGMTILDMIQDPSVRALTVEQLIMIVAESLAGAEGEAPNEDFDSTGDGYGSSDGMGGDVSFDGESSDMNGSVDSDKYYEGEVSDGNVGYVEIPTGSLDGTVSSDGSFVVGGTTTDGVISGENGEIIMGGTTEEGEGSGESSDAAESMDLSDSIVDILGVFKQGTLFGIMDLGIDADYVAQIAAILDSLVSVEYSYVGGEYVGSSAAIVLPEGFLDDEVSVSVIITTNPAENNTTIIIDASIYEGAISGTIEYIDGADMPDYSATLEEIKKDLSCVTELKGEDFKKALIAISNAYFTDGYELVYDEEGNIIGVEFTDIDEDFKDPELSFGGSTGMENCPWGEDYTVESDYAIGKLYLNTVSPMLIELMSGCGDNYQGLVVCGVVGEYKVYRGRTLTYTFVPKLDSNGNPMYEDYGRPIGEYVVTDNLDELIAEGKYDVVPYAEFKSMMFGYNAQTGAITAERNNCEWKTELVSGGECETVRVYKYTCTKCGDIYYSYSYIEHEIGESKYSLIDEAQGLAGGMKIVYSCSECGKEISTKNVYVEVSAINDIISIDDVTVTSYGSGIMVYANGSYSEACYSVYVKSEKGTVTNVWGSLNYDGNGYYYEGWGWITGRLHEDIYFTYSDRIVSDDIYITIKLEQVINSHSCYDKDENGYCDECGNYFGAGSHECYDVDGDNLCEECKGYVDSEENIGCACYDDDGDGWCDNCGLYLGGNEDVVCDCFDKDGDGWCDYCGSYLGGDEKVDHECYDDAGDGYCDLCDACLVGEDYHDCNFCDYDMDGVCNQCGKEVVWEKM